MTGIPKTKAERSDEAAATQALRDLRANPVAYSTTAADIAAVLVALGVMEADPG